MPRTRRVVTRAAIPVAVLGLLSLTACRLPGDPQGSLDAVRIVLNQVTVSGWAFDESDPSAPIQVHVYVDGRFKRADDAAFARPDVAEAHPEAGIAHGYYTVFNVGIVGLHTVCVYAINIGDGATNTELGCKKVSITHSGPIGNLDSVVRNGVEIRFDGWVIDPATTDPVTIEATVNGVAVARSPAGYNRLDVEVAYPGYGWAHGFRAQVMVPTSQQLTSETRLCIRAVHTSGGSVTLWCRQSDQIPAHPWLDRPTYLTGALASAAAIGAGTVRVTGSLVDSFDPDDTRGTYEVWMQSLLDPYPGGQSRADRARTAPGGGFDTSTRPTQFGPARVCLIGFETSTAPGDMTPRTIDCRDIVVT